MAHLYAGVARRAEAFGDIGAHWVQIDVSHCRGINAIGVGTRDIHLMVWLSPSAQLTAVLGAVTIKGPAAVAVVTATDASFVPPPPARLSRAVTRKFMVRAVLGSTSAVSQVVGAVVLGSAAVAGATFALLRIKRRLGNKRVGEGVGAKLRKIGRAPSSTMVPSALAAP